MPPVAPAPRGTLGADEDSAPAAPGQGTSRVKSLAKIFAPGKKAGPEDGEGDGENADLGKGVKLVEAHKGGHRNTALAALGLSLYTGVGVTIGTQVEGWDILTSLYFSSVTITTVGYGAVAPKTETGRILVALYIVLGLMLLTWALSVVTEVIADHVERTRQRRLRGLDVSEAGPLSKIMRALSFVVLFMAVGMSFFVVHSGMNTVDAFYFCVVSLTTVGYGDIVITDRTGRAFLMMYLLVGTVLVGKTIGASIDAILEGKRKALQHAILKQGLSERDLFRADADMSGELAESEFVLFKLQRMGLVEHEDLTRITEEFRRLDIDNSGTITVKEAMESLEKQRKEAAKKKEEEAAVTWRNSFMVDDL